MKTLTLTFCFSLFSYLGLSQYNWAEQTNDVSSSFIKDVDFIDENTGWAAVNSIGIIYTVNGGDTWTNVSIAGSFNPVSLSFINHTMGWIIDASGRIYHSNDGGINWIAQFNPGLDSYWAKKIFFLNESYGWAVSDTAIIKTSNGGSSWDVILNPFSTSSSIYDVKFINQNDGYIICQGATQNFAKTNDGGATWILSNVPTTDQLNGLELTPDGAIWVCNSNGSVFNSSDNGNSWNEIVLESGVSFKDIDFLDENTGVVVGNGGKTYMSHNGGNNWINNSYSSYDLEAVVMVGTKACSVGPNGRILKGTRNSDMIVEYYTGQTKICKGSEQSIILQIKNIGLSAINDINISLIGDQGSILTFDWNGVLYFPFSNNFNIGTLTLNQTENFTVSISGDDVISNNVYTFTIETSNEDNIFVSNHENVCPNESIEIFANGGDGYYWPDLNSTNQYNTITTPANDISYVVLIDYQYESYSCQKIDTVYITIDQDCTHSNPSAFSPNGDGINEYFHIEGIENTINFVTIFNRWGDIVAYLPNYDNIDVKWSGENEYDGQAVANSTYFYMVEIIDENNVNNNKIVKGWVQVLR